MRIGFIGGGKVGRSFGKYLVDNGFNVMGYYSRSYSSAVASANYTDSKPFEMLHQLIDTVGIIFVTTPDDALQSICNEISNTRKLRRDHLLVHMSGAHSSEVFNNAKKFGCSIYSLHPLQAFANIDVAVENLKNTVFSIEGDEENLDKLVNIMKLCGNQYFILDGKNKPLYHAAACVVSNYLVTLMDLSIKMLKAADINEIEGFKAMYPLIIGSLNNVKDFGTVEALTGPIARGDVNTIRKHLDVMKVKAPNEALFYKRLGEETTKLANEKKLKDKKIVDCLNTLWKEEII
ncbi:DUF2520 domain-containing protein [Alkaliphilus pronyensis]|uniref:DUF2520 domain-containing protein n=1 Tax=Alkaliphilus pronyensis TaxID=1482732 RepID=A0A6I0FMY7_9FIRM|nr:Rossmann-like and DUF2520 domain-containing protein [Alkaliphilus pronyensis]KAB3537704.1 DUF2520 domain-containing protein [Alkaliphilus pronyensis]